uniref:Uncharacterized protein n=1 Tax=Anguilla anguilla TaxID=7936 RepID=A0A0E9VPE1_ANGAN
MSLKQFTQYPIVNLQQWAVYSTNRKYRSQYL